VSKVLELTEVKASSGVLQSCSLSETTKSFLQTSGLPSITNFLDFSSLTTVIAPAEKYVGQLSLFEQESLYVVGKFAQSDCFICVDKDDDKVYCICRGGGEKNFCNMNVELLFKCAHALLENHYQNPDIPITQRASNRRHKLLKSLIEAIDPDCLKYENSIWSEELYEVKHFF
jgi:hypothetical protein